MSQIVEEEKIIESEVESVIDQGRVINFSDAVFAFAATLLVLKIDIPQLSGVDVDGQLVSSLYQMWPQYLANLVSFLVIGYYWLSHHIIFGLIKRFDRMVVWLNILFLISLSFLPFPVDLYGDYYNVPSVVVFYSFSLSLVGLMLSMIWLYASHNNRLIDKKMSDKRIRFFSIKLLIAPFVFAAAIPLVYIHPMVVQAAWLFVILGVYVVNKMFGYRHISTKNDMGL